MRKVLTLLGCVAAVALIVWSVTYRDTSTVQQRADDLPYLTQVSELAYVIGKEPRTIEELYYYIEDNDIPGLKREYSLNDLHRYNRPIHHSSQIKELVLNLEFNESSADWRIYFFQDTIYYHHITLYDPGAEDRHWIGRRLVTNAVKSDASSPTENFITAIRRTGMTIEPTSGHDFELQWLYKDRASHLRSALDKKYGVARVTRIDSEDSGLYQIAMYGGAGLQAGEACGIGGRDPEVTVMVKELAKSGNIDALVSLTRGVSLTGRIMAAQELLQLSRNSYRLHPDVIQSIEAIRNIPDEIMYCSGCIGTPTTAAQILR